MKAFINKGGGGGGVKAPPSRRLNPSNSILGDGNKTFT